MSLFFQEDLNTSSSSQKKLAPITAKKSPIRSNQPDAAQRNKPNMEGTEKPDSNEEDESNMSSASSGANQSVSNAMSTTPVFANSPSKALNAKNTQSGSNNKKRGRPRLYEMNPSTGKSIKGSY